MITVEQIRPYKDKMLEDLAAIVKYDSSRKSAVGNKPFGEENAACLEEALGIAEKMGFETVNMDNFCGYAEIGEGEEIIGIAGHLDIVPAGKGWDTDPFTLTEKEGRVYGRGVSDDKGACIASLYALKFIKESGIKLNKRIRVIFGCNEESGSACMKHYVKYGEKISVGFTPDGNFPGIHGEKGMCSMRAYSKNTKIISMNGGFVTNAVCDRCETVVKASDVDKAALEKALSASPLVSFSVTEKDDTLVISATGVSAHAAHPLSGVNAAGCTMVALEAAGMKDDFVDFYLDKIGLSCDGIGIGLKCSDDYGVLTLNNGIVKTEDGQICCTIDIRYPVTMTGEELKNKCSSYMEDERGKIELNSITESLFYPVDSPLVKSLYDAYVCVTGDDKIKPEVMGGGTYAKSIPGIIAFGCKFPNTPDNHIHDANESLDTEELLLQTAIYVKAIENLLAV